MPTSSHTLPENSLVSLEGYLDMQRAVGNETRYHVLVELLAGGEMSAKELADALDEPSNRLDYHLDKLVEVGLLQNRTRKERGADGLYSYYVPTAMGEAIMNHASPNRFGGTEQTRFVCEGRRGH